MRQDRKAAIALRKRGYSYNVIHKKLGVPISTLSDWFSDIHWSQEIKRDLTKRAFEKVYPQLQAMKDAWVAHWRKYREAARKEAVKEFGYLHDDPLFVTGVMLYWGEGEKKNRNSVRLGNTDPGMIKIFVDFLRRICKVRREKISAWLLLYPDLDETECKNFWSTKAALRTYEFKKSIVIKGRHKTNRLSWGVCTIVVHDTALKTKITEWIGLFTKHPPVTNSNRAGIV